MAVTQTTRLGIYRWTAGGDEYNRAQMDASHASLESLAAVFLSGAIAARPAVSATVARAFYLATDQNAPVGILYYCDGSTWQAVNNFGTPVALAPGATVAAGTATTPARSDHVHSLPAWGVVGELVQVGTTAAEGTVAKFARVDHRHVLADGSVTAGKIGVGGVSASNQIANAIIQSYHFAPGAVASGSISEDARIPVGAIMPYTSTTAPTGWLLCDGASYSTGLYSALFGVISHRYGGSGVNFNVPNLVDRVPRGATAFGNGATFGLTGGSDTVTLTTANLPAHTHPIDHSHTSVTVGNQSNDHTHSIAHNHGTISSEAGGVEHQHSIAHDHASKTTSNESTHTHGINHDHPAQSFSVTVGDNTTDLVTRLTAHVDNGWTSGKNTIPWNSFNPPIMAMSSGLVGPLLGMAQDFIDSHTHANSTVSVDLNNLTGVSTSSNTGHDHTVIVNGFTGNSGNSTAFSHAHSVVIPAFTGTSGGISANHNHTVTIPAFTGTSGSTGSAAAVDVRDRFVTMSFIIKI